MTRPDDANWLKPLWVRVLLLAGVVGWCLLEWFVWHDPFFRWATLAAIAYGVWSLFVDFRDKPDKP